MTAEDFCCITKWSDGFPVFAPRVAPEILAKGTRTLRNIYIYKTQLCNPKILCWKFYPAACRHTLLARKNFCHLSQIWAHLFTRFLLRSTPNIPCSISWAENWGWRQLQGGFEVVTVLWSVMETPSLFGNHIQIYFGCVKFDSTSQDLKLNGWKLVCNTKGKQDGGDISWD